MIVLIRASDEWALEGVWDGSDLFHELFVRIHFELELSHLDKARG